MITLKTKTSHPHRPYRAIAVTNYPSAQCLDDECPWGRGKSQETLTAAKAHVAETGHPVEVLTSGSAIWRAQKS